MDRKIVHLSSKCQERWLTFRTAMDVASQSFIPDGMPISPDYAFFIPELSKEIDLSLKQIKQNNVNAHFILQGDQTRKLAIELTW